MTDREKVIKGLECCKASTNDDQFQRCSECPYNNISISVQDCRAVLSADALELLKEQEAVEPIRMHHTEHKQTDNYRCQKCGNDLYFEQRFCEACGQEVKWKK